MESQYKWGEGEKENRLANLHARRKETTFNVSIKQKF